MLTIWGRPTAFNAQKVVWAAEEVGIPYERIDAGTKWGVVDTPEYRRLNPNGLVPVIQMVITCCGSRTRSCDTSAASTAGTIFIRPIS
jgi:glutathione S-transferase